MTGTNSNWSILWCWTSCQQPRICNSSDQFLMIQASEYLVSRIHRPSNWHERTKAAGKHLRSASLR